MWKVGVSTVGTSQVNGRNGNFWPPKNEVAEDREAGL